MSISSKKDKDVRKNDKNVSDISVSLSACISLGKPKVKLYKMK